MDGQRTDVRMTMLTMLTQSSIAIKENCIYPPPLRTPPPTHPPTHTHTYTTSALGPAYCLPYQLVGAADGGLIAFRQTMLHSFQNLYYFVCPLVATIRSALTKRFYFSWHQPAQIRYLAVGVSPELYDAYH